MARGGEGMAGGMAWQGGGGGGARTGQGRGRGREDQGGAGQGRAGQGVEGILLSLKPGSKCTAPPSPAHAQQRGGLQTSSCPG